MAAESASAVRFGRLRRMAGSFWVRLLVTVGLLGIVASRIDWPKVGHRLENGNPLDFFVAVALVFGSLVIGGFRWAGLLRAAGIGLPLPRVARIYAIATFSGTFLPTTAGGDVTRSLLVARRGPALTRAVVSVVVDRAGGLLGMLGIAWIAVAFAPSAVPVHSRQFLLWVTVGLALASAVIVAVVRSGPGRARKLLPVAVASHLGLARTVLLSYLSDARVIVMVVLTSLAFQALVALQLVFLGRAINVHLPYATAAVALALVTLATLLPISIGGFGVREGTYVLLLKGAHIGATDATLISILSAATLLVASLPGAVLLARRGVAPAIAEGAS